MEARTRWPDEGLIRELLLLLLMALTIEVQAQDFTYTNTNGTITITDYIGPGGAVVIPSVLDGLPVTSIGPEAFGGRSPSSVTIPEGVTNLGYGAFISCVGLTNVTIPASMVNISDSAFSGCPGLTSIRIPGSVATLGDWAFSYCTGLTNITISPGVSSIGGAAFYSCTSLPRITIPDSVTDIKDGFLEKNGGIGAFSYCSNLTNIVIGRGVTNLGAYAFAYCSNLTTIYFKGDAPTKIGSSIFGVFYYWTNVTVFYLPGTQRWTSTFAGAPTMLWSPAQQIRGMGSEQLIFSSGQLITFSVRVDTPRNLGHPSAPARQFRPGSPWFRP
jgi:hypothetical protein